MAAAPLFFLLIFAASLTTQLKRSDAQHANLGVYYGTRAYKLPPPASVVDLYEANKFESMRIYSPDHNILRALNGSNIKLAVGIPNHEVSRIASHPTAALNWLYTNIMSYDIQFRYIVVGQKDMVDENSAQDVLHAITKLSAIISTHDPKSLIKVTTEVTTNVLGTYDMSASEGRFKNISVSGPYMEPIVKFLASQNSPLFIVCYPYTFISKEGDDSSTAMPIFQRIIDTFYSALEKVEGGDKVRVVVGETGWPTAGGSEYANIMEAETYYSDVLSRVGADIGTFRKPGVMIETYVYSMFDEDFRSGVWKNFGLFYANMTSKYLV